MNTVDYWEDKKSFVIYFATFNGKSLTNYRQTFIFMSVKIRL